MVRQSSSIDHDESVLMKYTSSTIYFWSGTGNSYRVSNWIKTLSENFGVSSHILALDQFTSEKPGQGDNDRFLAIVFPTHGFTAPWQVIKSVSKFPRGNGIDAFCVATRAGLKFGPLFVPGISGSALFIIGLILWFKGYKVRGALSVDMPSNWFSLHPIQGSKTHEAIIARAEQKIGGFINALVSQSRVWLTPNMLYEFFFGVLLSFISVLYLLFGRFFLAKLFFANNNCDGCGICANNCVVNGIAMRGKDKRIPFWKWSCESCMKCAAICPRHAIEAGHSWGILLYFITAFPLSLYLLSSLGVDVAASGTINSTLIITLVDILYLYVSLFLSYAIFNFLIRIPLINSIFTYTTMTHLPFWGRYREPNTKLKGLKD